jgi:molybdenum cofactor cytidylyltransferase
MRSVVPKAFAVVKPGAERLAEALSEYCEIVVCDNAADGMGASLACAARAAGKADGYLIALADMPFVRASSIAAVRDAIASGAPLAAPYFRARRGHPVGISGDFFEQLLATKGDEGARQLLSANESRLVKIPVGDPGVIRDIDTPEDLSPPLKV